MMSPKKQPGRPKSSPRRPAPVPHLPIELPDSLWERISQKAFELWQERGYRDGHDLEDWFDAKTIVMEEIHEARE